MHAVSVPASPEPSISTSPRCSVVTDVERSPEVFVEVPTDNDVAEKKNHFALSAGRRTDARKLCSPLSKSAMSRISFTPFR